MIHKEDIKTDIPTPTSESTIEHMDRDIQASTKLVVTPSNMDESKGDNDFEVTPSKSPNIDLRVRPPYSP